MTNDELQKFKTVLEEDKKRLEEELKSLANTDFGSDVDSGDEEADEGEALATNIPIAGVLEERLKGIQKALEKIEAGTYGTCDTCGEEIPVERLEAKPESTHCTACSANG